MYKITYPDKRLEGIVQLASSKSISNRILLIQALCQKPFKVFELSDAQDTVTMAEFLAKDLRTGIFDVGPAGTTFRFLTAYFALQPGTQLLTGSDRMLKRPIGPLVQALNTVGADIEYTGEPGYPPIRIHTPTGNGSNIVEMDARISSQFISAILMIAPLLPRGLQLSLAGQIVSRSYIEMTLRLMQIFGVEHTWSENTITIEPQTYRPQDYTVEKDWSGASYFFSMAALADETHLRLPGLNEESIQGDSVVEHIIKGFGVKALFDEKGLLLTSGGKQKKVFEYNFLLCPDLAQTMVVLCAATATTGLFTGLETLAIKETDRTLALRNELTKAGSLFVKLPEKFHSRTPRVHYLLEGTFEMPDSYIIETYDDHRMAMAFSPLALKGEICIKDPGVVRKSFPGFWNEMRNLGFKIEEV